MEHQFDWLKGFIFPYINFFLFVAMLYFLARPKINAALANRRTEFERQLAEAQRAKKEAEEENRLLKERMRSLDQDIQKILQNAKQSAEAEAKSILENAEQLSLHIREEAKRLAQTEVESAKAELQSEIVRQTLAIVETKLSSGLGADLQSKLFERGLGSLKQAGIGGKA